VHIKLILFMHMTGSGDMLNCSKKLYMLTIMILAMISQNWIWKGTLKCL